MNKITVSILAAIAVCLCYVSSPYLKLWQIQRAIGQKDVVALERDIDWDAVRAGMKSDMIAAFNSKTSATGNGFAEGLAMLIGPAIIEKVTESISASALVAKVDQQGNDSHLDVSKKQFTGLTEFTVWLGDKGEARAVMDFNGLNWVVKRVVIDLASADSLMQQKPEQKIDVVPAARAPAISLPAEDHDAAPVASKDGDTFSQGQNTLIVSRRDGQDYASLNGAKILENDLVGVYQAFPDEKNPQIVLLTDQCNGSACSWTNVTLVDLGAMPAIAQPAICLADVALTGAGKDKPRIMFDSHTLHISGIGCEVTKLGDPVQVDYTYDRGRHILYSDEVTDQCYLDIASNYPYDLFKEQSPVRPGLVGLLKDDFRTARDAFGTAAPMQIHNGRLISGTGCIPHMCGNGGIIVIDAVTKNMWVAWMAEDQVVHFRATRPLDVGQQPGDQDVWALFEDGAKEWTGDHGERISLPPLNPKVPLGSFDRSGKATEGEGSSGQRLATSGPSFDCTKAPKAEPQLICSHPGLSLLDRQFAQAYYALRQQEGPAASDTLRDEANAFQINVQKKCAIPDKVTSLADPESAAKCLSALYQGQRGAWLSRLSGDALIEATRDIDLHLKIQAGLKNSGFLSADATIDGVYGLSTRNAIAAWQKAHDVPQTGIINNPEAATLLAR